MTEQQLAEIRQRQRRDKSMNELEIEEVRRCLDARWDLASALKTRELLEKSINIFSYNSWAFEV